MFRSDVVERLNTMVAQATALLEQAAVLAEENGIPFEYDLTGKVDEPVWQSSDDHWYSSSC